MAEHVQEPSAPVSESPYPFTGTMIDSDHVELPDGRVLDLSASHPPPGAKPVSLSMLDRIEPFLFEVCPMCLAGNPTSWEHVPPAALGGRKLTRTCEDCNHRFGPLEAELDRHRRNAVRGPSFVGPTVLGQRRAREFTLSLQVDGAPVWVLDRMDPAVREMLKNGSLEMTYELPNRALWSAALLKHAYLAAVVYLRAIPHSADAVTLREELLAARQAGADHKMGAVAAQLRSVRIYQDPPAPVYLAVAELDGKTLPMLGLGRYGAVAWPIPDLMHGILAE